MNTTDSKKIEKNYARIIFDKIENVIEDSMTIDLHNVPQIMVGDAWWSRLTFLLESENQKRINDYFNDNEDIYEHIEKTYSPEKILRLCNRILS